jgi:hypothetical protein
LIDVSSIWRPFLGKSRYCSAILQKGAIVPGLKRPRPFATTITQRNLILSFFGVARKRNLVFIAIGDLHLGMA